MRIRLAVLGLIAALGVAPTAVAQTPGGDSVAGNATPLKRELHLSQSTTIAVRLEKTQRAPPRGIWAVDSAQAGSWTSGASV